RFAREAAILEELGEHHPQIPTLYAYFEADGQFYLVQEYIEGDTLTQQVQQQGTFSEDRVRDILSQLLAVLEYVHSRNIIHRDIKPDNILLRHSDSKPILIDFGAVRETMTTVATPSGNTVNSIVVGTPGFMPSEQNIGRPVFSSDLYALGLTAIYLLTGKFPRELTTDPQTGEITWRHTLPSLSNSLAEILDKSMRSHPRERFPSAREMLNALHGQTMPPPTVQSPPASQYKTVPVGGQTPTQPPQQIPQKTNNNLSIIVAILGAAILISASLVWGLTRPRFADNSTETPAEDTEQPINSPSPQPPSQAPPTPTPTPSPSVTIETPESPPSNEETPPNNPVTRPNPETVVQSYYSNINNEQYYESWQMLPSEIQDDSGLHPNGYLSYYDWWDSVERVGLKTIETVEVNPENAIVETSYNYFMKQGNTTPQSIRFYLRWNESQQQWNIARIKVLS
ncbi:serine/threonine-protein kinase, partial [Spirulina sp. CS-785/01]|uniref:serine/threonine-protein kinase n=1 Tax=Spirulina sp. CS-785/01 TaxID=3021716 RepID=UPI00232FC643